MPLQIVEDDCLAWLERREEKSVHAVITDPPFGLREYNSQEIDKLRSGRGGVWRIPPAMGGCKRAPLPRFTVLSSDEVQSIHQFFLGWGKKVLRVLVPGGHVMIATSPLFMHVLFGALSEAGLESRGAIIRLVRTIRGGYRPKGAEDEFPDVSTMPRACYEPWGLFRRPFEGTLAANLRIWGSGGLRRARNGLPFCDVIESERTPQREREIADHPSLKPQSLMRQLVWAALPLGRGVVVDTFLGGGSTLAAAEALGVHGIGIEIEPKYAALARRAVPQLAKLDVELPGVIQVNGSQLRFTVDGTHVTETAIIYDAGVSKVNGNGKHAPRRMNGNGKPRRR